jgi:hypothetical protein
MEAVAPDIENVRGPKLLLVVAVSSTVAPPMGRGMSAPLTGRVTENTGVGLAREISTDTCAVA